MLKRPKRASSQTPTPENTANPRIFNRQSKTMRTPTNPPAFPVPDSYCPNGQVRYGSDGMTLRDYFAAKALEHIPELLAANERNRSVSNIAEWAYQVADAMLAVREPRAQTETIQL